MPTDYLKWRMRIINVSPANAKQEAERIDKSENHIPTFFLFAKNEAEQGKIKDTVTAIFDKVGERCIVVDFSSLPFTDALFSKFIESKAKEKYFSTIPNQKSQLELAKKTSQEVLNEWTRKLITTSLYVYSAPNKSVQKTGGANLRKEFKEINGEFFGAGLEEITQMISSLLRPDSKRLLLKWQWARLMFPTTIRMSETSQQNCKWTESGAHRSIGKLNRRTLFQR